MRIRRATRALFSIGVLIVIANWCAPMLESGLRAIRVVMQPPARSLSIPVDGVAVRGLRDSWGAPRSGGRRHQGIDIVAPRGTTVRSTTPGVVWRIGQNRLGGNVVWVLGPGAELHYYAHLQRFAAIHAGQMIIAGTPLGYVGDTGNARGGPCHLHYGIYAAGGAINPFPLLGNAGGTSDPRRQ